MKTMERRGLIRRWTDSADGRRMIVAITPEGRRLLNKVSPHSERQYEQILQRMGRKNLEALYEQLERLTDTFSEPAATSPDEPLLQRS